MNLVTLNEVTLGYGKSIVLENISLSVERGVFLPFVGPNGAGKTTLLKAILGLLNPIKGKISLHCEKSAIGYVSQQKAIDPLYPVSVLDIVLMGAYPKMRYFGFNEKKFIERAMSLLRNFKLEEHASKIFSELSGGMRQKVIVARALMGDNSLLIMDEPTTELDHHSQMDLLQTLKALVKNEGKTVLMVHHGLELITELAETVCLVNEGKASIKPIKEARF